MFRRRSGGIEVLLVHPGGPFWAKKDSWTLPKGEYEDGEEAFAAALREFEEETGVAPSGPFVALGEIRQPSGKLVKAWAFEGDCDCSVIRSNTFSMEWPRGSGRMQEFPEVDRGAWFGVEAAREKMFQGQAELLERLVEAAG